MKILKPKYIIYGENLEVLKGYAIAFDTHIKEIAKADEIVKKYPNSKVIEIINSVAAPAFINTHTHLEFSANKTELVYGDFITWLGSIIKHSQTLTQKCTKEIMQTAVLEILKSGTASLGAISSFGKDTEILANSPLRVIHFNEILGSNPNLIEQNFNAFLKRFNNSNKFKNERFTPAISLHSPYSIHKDLAKKALEFAKKHNLIISTHFLESIHEKQWLKSGSGKFKNHLKKFIPNPKPIYTQDEYLAQFNKFHTLFTHCVYVDKFDIFDKNHSITHCPSSNRLLGKKALNLKKLIKSNVSLNIGTDGLSSNLSLNMFDELRAAIFTHSNVELNMLCKILFKAATLGGAKALNINSGVLEVNKFADIMVLNAPNCEENELLTQLLLHTKYVKQLYIGGEICKF